MAKDPGSCPCHTSGARSLGITTNIANGQANGQQIGSGFQDHNKMFLKKKKWILTIAKYSMCLVCVGGREGGREALLIW